jgi:DNA-directed RNA polymerase I subunit RPA1
VILNRQPTLHKPSMMAHKVKVLQGEKTIRMHYANWYVIIQLGWIGRVRC